VVHLEECYISIILNQAKFAVNRMVILDSELGDASNLFKIADYIRVRVKETT
jgi:hypothetical protein